MIKPVLSVDRAPVIAVVVGEASGDLLGAGLMQALKQRFPSAQFIGIGGPRMIAEGFESLFPQDRLAVMGLVEPLKRLPELLSMRQQLIDCFINIKPLVVIGIDAPAFNTDLELAVRRAGIKTVHYVSPSVWAWRQGRIKKIAKAVDLMLTLLPFEAQIYRDHQVPVKFVGHPLADEIPLKSAQADALKALNLAEKAESEAIIALLPGSRSSEVQKLAPVFLQAAALLQRRIKHVRFLIPSANDRRHQQLSSIIQTYGRELPITLIHGQSLQVMAAADVVLMASGTTTLEALLLKRPMVIAYKVAALSYWLFKMLVRVKFIGLPNLLAGREVVPEFIQHRATPEQLCSALEKWLKGDCEARQALIAEFDGIHRQLRQDANNSAAAAICNMLEGKHEN